LSVNSTTPSLIKGKVIAKLRRLASGAFDAGMGGQAGKKELLNSTFAKLLIKICSLKRIKRPMPTGHDVASLWIKRLVEGHPREREPINRWGKWWLPLGPGAETYRRIGFQRSPLRRHALRRHADTFLPASPLVLVIGIDFFATSRTRATTRTSTIGTR